MVTILNINELDNMLPHITLIIDRTGYEGWYVPQRTIRDQEIVLILGGKGSFTIEDIEYPVRPGMLFYFYPGLVHSAKTLLDPPIHFLAMHFSFAISKVLKEECVLDTNPYILPIQPVSQLVDHHTISQIFYEIHHIWMKKNMGYQWKQNLLFQQLIYEILSDVNNLPDKHADIQRIEVVLDYIRKNYASNISIENLCSLIELRSAQFSIIFKKATGKTAVEYINQVRIDHSKDLLLNTSKKIRVISDMSGFNDEFYFTRVFTKLEGCSPTEYRYRHIGRR